MATTTHGHHIPGTVDLAGAAQKKVRCGGIDSCPKCNYESVYARVWKHSVTPSYSQDEEIVTVDTVELIRKPFFATGVQITEENLEAVATWCTGRVQTGIRNRANNTEPQKYVFVPVLRTTAEWQKCAWVGDWVIKAGSGYKIYNDRALKGTFDVVSDKVERELTSATDCD